MLVGKIHLYRSTGTVLVKMELQNEICIKEHERDQRNLTRFNKVAIQARAQTAADKEAAGLSRVHMYESKCILP